MLCAAPQKSSRGQINPVNENRPDLGRFLLTAPEQLPLMFYDSLKGEYSDTEQEQNQTGDPGDRAGSGGANQEQPCSGYQGTQHHADSVRRKRLNFNTQIFIVGHLVPSLKEWCNIYYGVRSNM
jgi:hypothetical protein